jgi:hypothetical protein
MIFSEFRLGVCVTIFCAICIFPSGRLFAQAPPGPLPPSHPLPPPPPPPPAKKKPEVEPRKSMAGFWKLNSDDSDDPQQKLEEARQTRAGSGGGPGSGPGSGGGGPVGIGFPPFPGGGPNGPNGPYGGGGRGMSDGGETTEEMREIIRPDYSQTIELKDTEVDSTDEHENKQVFYTDGRKIQKSKDDSLKQVSAHWNGSQLVTDERGPRGRKMSRTLELSSDGKQLYETWHIENGKSGSVIVIRYVYDAANEYQR